MNTYRVWLSVEVDIEAVDDDDAWNVADTFKTELLANYPTVFERSHVDDVLKYDSEGNVEWRI